MKFLIMIFVSLLFNVIGVRSFDYFCYKHRHRAEITSENTTYDFTDCENNQIFMKYYANMKQIRVIKGRNNGIWKLNDYEIQEKTPNLLELDLSKNEIINIERFAFRGLNQLSILTLSENQVESLHVEIFKGLVSLTELYLNKNQIGSLESGIFQDNKNLKKIDFSENKISLIGPDVFQGLVHLEFLNLNMNQCIKKNFAFHQFRENNDIGQAVFEESTCIDSSYCRGHLKDKDNIRANCPSCQKMKTELETNITSQIWIILDLQKNAEINRLNMLKYEKLIEECKIDCQVGCDVKEVDQEKKTQDSTDSPDSPDSNNGIWITLLVLSMLVNALLGYLVIAGKSLPFRGGIIAETEKVDKVKVLYSPDEPNQVKIELEQTKDHEGYVIMNRNVEPVVEVQVGEDQAPISDNPILPKEESNKDETVSPKPIEVTEDITGHTYEEIGNETTLITNI